MSDTATLHLDPDEAIVLIGLLSRWIDRAGAPTPGADCFESPAECAVLHVMLTDLEMQVEAPLRADWSAKLAAARARQAHRWDGTDLRG